MKFSGTRTEKCHNRLSAFGVSGPIRAFISGVVVSIGHNRLSAFGVIGPTQEAMAIGIEALVTIAFRLLG